ncbi:UvrD-helicase domain-containing protein [Fontimonas sp. SYSU GA230001]|uniref:UvrD-helicase domain-containing protein n=1 Tax=Fontimonas sp. SYSU GA230001 TaxID=3142450 RepID=UPI0032B35C0A
MSPAPDPVVDAGERAAALDPARSFIVQAPAGSGKTELLTQRLLVLLGTVDEPEEVVAMTFTRKAAAEMRQRVFTAVRGALDETPPQDAHKATTWSLARAALARSRARGWRLEDNPQRLRVLTIDALCAQIVQQAPLTAGVGGRVQITEQAEPLYREAARATLAMLEHEGSAARAVARVLRHFDNRTAVLEQQLVDLLGKREQWLVLATREGRSARPREVLERTLQWIVEDALQRATAVVPEALRAAWLESARHASAQRQAEEPDLPLHLLRDGRWPSAVPDDLPRWRALLELVFTQGDPPDWRRTVNAKQGFPAGQTKAEKAQLGPARDAHLQLIDALAGLPGARSALLALHTLPAPRYEDAQWDVLQALLDTLRLAAAQLRVVFAARGEVDFAEVAAQAITALGDPERPSDLALKLDYRVRHLLIDEFQDTSSVQWELLLRLTAGWMPGDGRSLFLVGDPMQSIYRFREAEVGLFLRAWRDGIGGLSLEPLRLRCNFRSQPGIVEWVNAAFAQVLPPVADPNRGAVPYSPAQAVRAAGTAPAVGVHALVGADARAEALRVRELVLAARARDPQGTIAILVRSRGHLLDIVPVLRDAGIACRAVDIESLAERPVIGDLRALTWALLHPQDRSAWLAVLRAPWCGLTLADLYVLCADLPRQLSLLSALRDPARRQRLSAEGRQRLAPVLDAIEAALAVQGRRPLRRWVESAWLALGGPACAREPSALADAAAYFDCLQQVAPGAMLDDFARLDLALAQLRAAPDPGADGRVSVMTIHKSKGLEFDTVIVPGLARGTRSDGAPLIAWAQLSDVDGQERLVLAPVHATGDERDASYDYVRALDADKQCHEDGRLLYVAATRARQQLHLLAAVGRDAKGKVATPPGRSLLARLWPAVAAQFEAAATTAEVSPGTAQAAAAEMPAADVLAPPLRRRVGWTAPVLQAAVPLAQAAVGDRAAAPQFDWAGETARCVGIVFHRWVQFIAGDGVEHWPPARCDELAAGIEQDLRREGVRAAQLAAACDRVLAALRSTLGDARGRWLLRREHAESYSELALSVSERERVRRLVIDRCFVDEHGVRWIVDFKTSTHEGGDAASFVRQEIERYRPQLEAYVQALAALYRGSASERPLRAALYLPLIEDPALRWAELTTVAT